MKRYATLKTYVLGGCLALSLLLLGGCGPGVEIYNPATQDYVVGAPGTKGEVDIYYFKGLDEAFSIAASDEGYAVFEDPIRAFDKMKQLYGDTITEVQLAYSLSDLTYDNYDLYKTYSWQYSTNGASKPEDAKVVAQLLDIYENSFKGAPQEPGVLSGE